MRVLQNVFTSIQSTKLGTYMNIEQLKTQVARTIEENAAKVREAAEIARLEATLKLEQSTDLFNARVKIAADGQQTAKLQQLVDECAEIVASVPVFNTKTRTNRVWAGSHKYNYGSQIDLMYQLATGILYACKEHKPLLLAHTGLDLEVLNQVVKSFGTPTYYSRNYHTVVESKPYDIDMLKATLKVMQSSLGVVVDITDINEDNLKHEFERAVIVAQNNFAQANQAIDEAELEV